MGFVSKDADKDTDLILHGFEIAQTPFTTLLPYDYPLEEQDRYQILSMGDATYDYIRRYDRNDWTTTECSPSIRENAVSLSELFGTDAAVYSNRVSEFSQDYSFSGRFTYTVNCDPNDGNSSNITFFNPDTGKENGSFTIHIDILPSSNHYWKDSYGQGEWQFGTEPSNSSIGISLNGDMMHEYCYSEYLGFRESGSVHEIWFEYDGHDKILYVYVAPYDTEGNVQKPNTPTLMLNIDLEELFGGTHRFDIELSGDGGWDPAEFIYRGIEFDPYPAIHGSHESDIEILSPADGDVFTIGEEIDVFGRINSIDADTLSILLLNEGDSTVFSDERAPNSFFSSITTIDTGELTPGDYTLFISISSEGEVLSSELIDITLIPDPVIDAAITGNTLTIDGMDVFGTIDITEDSEYILYRHNTTDDFWTIVSEGEGNKNDESIGFIDFDDLPDRSVYLRLVITLESGRVITVYKTFEYDKNAILYPDQPTPSPTPTVTPIDYTDEELFVDVDNEQEGMEVSFVTDIVGTVSGTLLDRYTFEVYPVNSDVAVYTSTGTSEVIDEALGTLDATLLVNGYYLVKVTAYASDGCGLYDEVTVLVCGNAKIGNYSISFNDLSTGLNNFPIQIYRTYDSRRRNELGDFGYGWEMTIGGPRISVSGDLSSGWGYEKHTTVAVPLNYWKPEHAHEIYIDWGNGHSETFELSLSPEKWIDAPMGTVSACFINKSGKSDKLTILDKCEGLSYEKPSKTILDSSYSIWNPQNFLLTTRDGVKYYFNLHSGLYKVEDTYGRTIEITDDGVFYSDGSGIEFVRDEEGKITSISDGTQSVSYSYENGDLTSVVDRANNTTSFRYKTDPAHYLEEIIDPLNHRVAKNIYDEDGRLISTIDADGNEIKFDHVLDKDHKVEVVTNRLGYSTVYEYDDWGNVISVKDALGRITYTEYDENHHVKTKTDAKGNTTYYDYSVDGDLLSVTDSLDRTMKTSYTSDGYISNVNQCDLDVLDLSYDEN